MEKSEIYIPDLSSEFVFQTSRSSGPGGQNVNKVNSRVELRFDIPNSVLLTDNQKELLQRKLATRITAEGVFLVVSQEERSQLRNKELSIQKCYVLIRQALKPVKRRRATRPTKGSVERRIQSKKAKGEKKSLRGRIDF